MGRAKRCRHLCSQLVEVRCLDSIHNTREDLLGKNIRIYSKSPRGLANSLQNLIEGYIYTLTVALENLHTIGHGRFYNTGL
jgi:hypothetical protein